MIWLALATPAILAMTLLVEAQFKAGRPGSDGTPALQGVARTPSAGRPELRALLRMVI
jgi:hypothetical protein